MEKVAQGKDDPVVCVDLVSDFFTKNDEGHVGEDDHQSSQGYRIESVEDEVDSFVERGHDDDERAQVHDCSRDEEVLEAYS